MKLPPAFNLDADNGLSGEANFAAQMQPRRHRPDYGAFYNQITSVLTNLRKSTNPPPTQTKKTQMAHFRPNAIRQSWGKDPIN
jgi:hypothetical protein